MILKVAGGVIIAQSAVGIIVLGLLALVFQSAFFIMAFGFAILIVWGVVSCSAHNDKLRAQAQVDAQAAALALALVQAGLTAPKQPTP